MKYDYHIIIFYINIFIIIYHSLLLGEMGYFRIETGYNSLGIEGSVVWATPGSWTVNNKACSTSGNNCRGDTWLTEYYVDPSFDLETINRRLRQK